MMGTPLFSERDFGGLKKFYLLLGTACNMRCRHCIQTPIKDGNDVSVRVDDKVMALVENYVRYAVGTPLQEGRKPFNLFFWGGEPLLYWDFIREQVVRLTEKYGILRNRNFRFRITTNGSLLTEEIVDFLNRYEVKLHFSYDAPYPFAVRDYVSDDVCALVRKVKGYEIQCNNCAYNCDPVLAHRCTKAKFPEALVQTNLKLVRTFDMPKDIYAYDMEKVRTAVRKIRIAFQLGHSFFSKWVLYRYLLPRALSKGRSVPDIGTERILCVSVDGRVMDGFNSGNAVADVSDSLGDVFEKVFRHKRSMLGYGCAVCRNRDICKAPCADIRDASGNFVSCVGFYIGYYDIVRGEMAKTAFPLSADDLAWYRRQEELDAEIVGTYLAEGERYMRERTRLPKGMMWMLGQG